LQGKNKRKKVTGKSPAEEKRKLLFVLRVLLFFFLEEEEKGIAGVRESSENNFLALVRGYMN
jgi:hypothetical protein